jgi:hypothetical protein
MSATESRSPAIDFTGYRQTAVTRPTSTMPLPYCGVGLTELFER